MIKRNFWSRISIYFLFVALAIAGSVYFLLLDSFGKYVSTADILVSPKNTKTAAYLGELKEGAILISQKNNILGEGIILISDEKSNLIEIQAHAESQEKSAELLNNAIVKISNLFGNLYDIKNDLSLEIISRKTSRENYSQSFIVFVSIATGIVLSFFIQLGISLLENSILFFINKKIHNKREDAQAEKYIGDFFRTNREKIQKLSSSHPLAEDVSVSRKKDEMESLKNKLEQKNISLPVDMPQANFKKAAFPANLPIAKEDLNKIIEFQEPVSSEPKKFNEQLIVSDKESVIISNQDLTQADNFKNALKEPTEEEFKKRLNQLLGNK